VGTFYRHLYYGVVAANLYPGGSPVADTLARQTGLVLALHVVFMCAAFALLLPLGSALGVLRPGSRWLGAHVALQVLGSGLALAGVALGALNRDSRQLAVLSSTHSIVGAAVGAGVVAQLIMGCALTRQPRALAPHRILAGFVMVAGLYNILLGTDRFTLALGLGTCSFLGLTMQNTVFVFAITLVAYIGFGLVGLVLLGFVVKRVCGMSVNEPASSQLDVNAKDDSAPPLPPKPPKPGTTEAEVLYDYASDHARDLPVTKGQRVRVDQTFDDGWSQCTDSATGRSGLVPDSYLHVVV